MNKTVSEDPPARQNVEPKRSAISDTAFCLFYSLHDALSKGLIPE